MKPGPSIFSKTNAHREQNILSAKLVLAMQERYGPAMQEWARMVLSAPDVATKTTERRSMSGLMRSQQQFLFNSKGTTN